MPAVRPSASLAPILDRAVRGDDLGEGDIVRLFEARGPDFAAVTQAADALRKEVVGDTISYAVVRNINYTNICYFRCGFCAFSKGKLAANLRGSPYDLTTQEIVRRATRSVGPRRHRSLHAGRHPSRIHRPALSRCLPRRARGDARACMSMPSRRSRSGTAPRRSAARSPTISPSCATPASAACPARPPRVLDDEVRDILCPDKVSTDQWLEIMRAAHGVGLRSTATIMFGHVDRPVHWARHLLRVRNLQKDTGGFTELVPLPFVAAEAPIALKGQARMGPTFREAVLMHSIGRLALHPHIKNIQTSWVKMGVEGARHCLQAGANDLGGTLMNESITRAAGAEHGEELPPDAMEKADREPRPHLPHPHHALRRCRHRAPRRRPRRQGAGADQARGRRTLDRLRLTESDKRRVLPKPRAVARVR